MFAPACGCRRKASGAHKVVDSIGAVAYVNRDNDLGEGRMSGNQEWWEFHLTPKGWVKGNERLADGAKDRPIPADRLLTIRQHEHASSPYAAPQTWSSIVWRHGDTRAIETMREQFGAMPPGSERFPFKS